MLGVLIVALGVPDVFHSLAEGELPRQRGHGGRLRRHARGDDRAVAARRRQRRSGAPQDLRSRTSSTSSIAQVGWVALIFVNLPGRHDVRDRRRAHPVRTRRSALRRAAVRPHALARPPHRGALRAARHHHARRGRARHHPGDLRRRAGRGVDAVEAALIALGGTALVVRTVVGLLHDAVGPDARTATASAGFVVGLRAHRPVRRARRRRPGPPRRRPGHLARGARRRDVRAAVASRSRCSSSRWCSSRCTRSS